VSPTRLLPAAVLAVALPLAGCAAGENATTSQERPTPYTADGKVGPVFVRNVVITPASGFSSSSPSTSASGSPSSSATPTESASATGSASAAPSESSSAGSTSSAQAYLSVTIASSTSDSLTGVSVPGATVTPSQGADFSIRPQQLLTVRDPQASASASGPTIEISGLPTAPLVGTTLPVTLTFQKAGSVTIQAPVREIAPTA
jgi:copper(I)-binding protein